MTDTTIVDLTTPEMRKLRSDAWWLLVNAAVAGLAITFYAGTRLYELKEASGIGPLVMGASGLYSLGAVVVLARSMRRTAQSVHRRIGLARTVLVSLVTIIIGAATSAAYIGARLSGFALSHVIHNAGLRITATIALFSFAVWLISIIMLRILINRQSVA